MKQIVLIFIAALFLTACLTTAKNKKVNENIKTYKIDLDNDGVAETIEIDDKSKLAGDIFVKLIKEPKIKKQSPRVCTFNLPGHFNKADFIDLNDNGEKQLVIYSDSNGNFANINIYKLKDDKLSKIFFASSNCDIETDFTSTIPRVKIGISNNQTKDCSAGFINDWETWIWSGEKFVREK